MSKYFDCPVQFLVLRFLPLRTWANLQSISSWPTRSVISGAVLGYTTLNPSLCAGWKWHRETSPCKHKLSLKPSTSYLLLSICSQINIFKRDRYNVRCWLYLWEMSNESIVNEQLLSLYHEPATFCAVDWTSVAITLSVMTLVLFITSKGTNNFLFNLIKKKHKIIPP